MCVTYLAAKEQKILQRRPWPISGCSQAEAMSVEPWRRRDRTPPLYCCDPMSSPFCATSLYGSGTTPKRTTSRRNVTHLTL